jgi:hypothetical protein
MQHQFMEEEAKTERKRVFWKSPAWLGLKGWGHMQDGHKQKQEKVREERIPNQVFRPGPTRPLI